MSSQLNLANAITIARILLIPVFLVLLLSGIPQPYGDIAAAAVFILAAATDKLDGYVARRNKQITTLGQFLDPLADKLLIAAALIALVSQDTYRRLGGHAHHRPRDRRQRAAHRRRVARRLHPRRQVRQAQDGPADRLRGVRPRAHSRHRRADPRVHRRGHRHPVDPGGRRRGRHLWPRACATS